MSPLVHEPLISWTTCGISNPFGLLSHASGQVTNALLTRSPLKVLLPSVRLACIRHAASVHPEPGSNSPQKLLTLSGLQSQQIFSDFDWFFSLTLSSYHSSVVKVLRLQSILSVRPLGIRRIKRRCTLFTGVEIFRIRNCLPERYWFVTVHSFELDRSLFFRRGHHFTCPLVDCQGFFGNCLTSFLDVFRWAFAVRLDIEFRFLNDLPSRAWIGDDQESAPDFSGISSFLLLAALICFSGNEGQLYRF